MPRGVLSSPSYAGLLYQTVLTIPLGDKVKSGPRLGDRERGFRATHAFKRARVCWSRDRPTIRPALKVISLKFATSGAASRDRSRTASLGGLANTVETNSQSQEQAKLPAAFQH